MYYVKIQDKRQGVKPHSVSLGTHDLDRAVAERYRLVQALTQGVYRRRQPETSLAAFLTLYEKHYLNAAGKEYKERRAKSWYADVGQLRGLFAFLGRKGVSDLGGVRRSHVEQYRDHRLATEEVSIETVKKAVRVAKAAWNWAVAMEYTSANPFARFPFARTKKCDPRNLSEVEIQVAFKAAETDPEKRAQMACALYSGLRLEEIETLEQTDITWGEYGFIRLAPGKDNEPRSTPLPPELQAILEPFKADTGRLFPRFARSSLQKFVRKIAKKMPVEWSLHDLRRTCSRLMAERGVPTTRIRDYLGHASVATTEGYYLGRNHNVRQQDNLALGLAPQVQSAGSGGAKQVG